MLCTKFEVYITKIKILSIVPKIVTKGHSNTSLDFDTVSSFFILYIYICNRPSVPLILSELLQLPYFIP